MVVIAVDIALVCYIIHLFLSRYHLVNSASGGEGHPYWEGFGIILCLVSNMTLVLCIFAVALGYSLNVSAMTIPGEAIIAIAICYAFVEAVLSFAQYKSYSVRYHLHMEQGVISVILGIFRILLGIGFYFCISGTVDRDDIFNPHVRTFLNKFRWRGISFLCLNNVIGILIAYTVASYNQLRYNFLSKTILEMGK